MLRAVLLCCVPLWPQSRAVYAADEEDNRRVEGGQDFRGQAKRANQALNRAIAVGSTRALGQ
jgi:hypothetical protein